jgi:hypothetical protein
MVFLDVTCDILISTIGTFLEPKDTTRLDTAFCSKDDRPKFLMLINHVGYTCKHLICIDFSPPMYASNEDADIRDWNISKNIKMTKIILKNFDFNQNVIPNDIDLSIVTEIVFSNCNQSYEEQDNFNDNLIDIINLCVNVVEVKLQFFVSLSEGHLKRIKPFIWKRITSLVFDNCPALSEAVIVLVSAWCKQLVVFTMTCYGDGSFLTKTNYSLSEECLIGLFANNPLLTKIKIHCLGISDVALAALASHCTMLQVLELSLSYRLQHQSNNTHTIGCVLKLSKSNPFIQRIHFKNRNGFTMVDIDFNTGSCVLIQNRLLSNCYNTELLTYYTMVPLFKTIILDNFPTISYNTLVSIGKTGSELTTLRLLDGGVLVKEICLVSLRQVVIDLT